MALLKRGHVIALEDIAASLYEWNKDITYKHPSYVIGPDRRVYFSLKDSINVNPVTNIGTYWEDYFNYNFQPKYEQITQEIKKLKEEMNNQVDWSENGNINLGQVLSDGTLLILNSGIFIAPRTGCYFIGMVGGRSEMVVPQIDIKQIAMIMFGGGGGGGAGQYVSRIFYVKKRRFSSCYYRW